MAWSFLGTKQPGFQWDLFDDPVIGDVSLRITQTYNPQEVSFLNKIQLGEFYPFPEADGFRFLTTIYPSLQPRIMPLQIPKPFADAGWTIRDLAVRHNRYGVAAVANWTVTIEVWW